MNENKQHILDLLLPALQATENLSDLESLTYCDKTGMVTAAFTKGGVSTVNVAGDSGTAMIQDIMSKIVYAYRGSITNEKKEKNHEA